MLESRIFELFTQKNNISLTRENLKFLSENVTSEDQLHFLLEQYLTHFHTKKCSHIELQQLVIQSTTQSKRFFEISESTHVNISLESKYKLLRDRLKLKLTEIRYLENESDVWVFGYVYRNSYNILIMEDLNSQVVIDLTFYKGRGVLLNDTFTLLFGKKRKDVFLVEKIKYSYGNPIYRENLNFVKRNISMLIFNEMVKMVDLNMILDKFDIPPELIMISGPFLNSLPEYTKALSTLNYKIQFVLIPDEKDAVNLRKPYKFSTLTSHTNIKMATNPCLVNICERSILINKTKTISKILDSLIYKSDDFFDNIAKIIISQFTPDVFEMKYAYDRFNPTSMIFLDDSPGLTGKVDDISYGFCPPHRFDGGCFLFYDSESNEIQFSSLKQE